jgi:hypothetical protein
VGVLAESGRALVNLTKQTATLGVVEEGMHVEQPGVLCKVFAGLFIMRKEGELRLEV